MYTYYGPRKVDRVISILTSPQARLRLSPTDLKDLEQAKPMLLQIVSADDSSNRSSQTVPFSSVCWLLLVTSILINFYFQVIFWLLSIDCFSFILLKLINLIELIKFTPDSDLDSTMSNPLPFVVASLFLSTVENLNSSNIHPGENTVHDYILGQVNLKFKTLKNTIYTAIGTNCHKNDINCSRMSDVSFPKFLPQVR